MLGRIIQELEIHIKACTDGMGKDCHPNDEDAYLNKIQAFNQAIRIVEGYHHLTSTSSTPAPCDCPAPTILEKSYCTRCGRDMG